MLADSEEVRWVIIRSLRYHKPQADETPVEGESVCFHLGTSEVIVIESETNQRRIGTREGSHP